MRLHGFQRWAVIGAAILVAATPAAAESLYRGDGWSHLASDNVASAAGDALLVVVYQSAEARNSERRMRRKNTRIDASLGFAGDLTPFTLQESGELAFGGEFSGQGEIRRSESILTQFSVTIADVLPNGDLVVAGEQQVRMNGEESVIKVRGRVRRADIANDNRVLSTRIADAEIDYQGRGFVTRGASEGIVTRIFSWLGLGL